MENSYQVQNCKCENMANQSLFQCACHILIRNTVDHYSKCEALYNVCLIFQFCKAYELEFLTWRCWIGFWVMIILFGVVALEGCFLIKYFTRFTEDIFELLISAIFIYEPIALLIKVRALRLSSSSYFNLPS